MLYPVCRLRSSSPNYCTRSTTWSRYDASVNVFERGYACACLFDVHMGQNVWCPRGICTHVCLCQRRVDYSSPVCDVMSVLCGVAAACVACTYTCFVHVQSCVQVVRDGQLQVEEEIARQKEVFASLMLYITLNSLICTHTCVRMITCDRCEAQHRLTSRQR